jgi:hypothetical protein
MESETGIHTLIGKLLTSNNWSHDASRSRFDQTAKILAKLNNYSALQKPKRSSPSEVADITLRPVRKMRSSASAPNWSCRSSSSSCEEMSLSRPAATFWPTL